MKMSKRIVIGMLAAAMAAAPLAGCGNGGNESSSSSPSSSSGASSSAGSGGGSSGTATEWEYQEDTSPYEFTVWWPSVWMGKTSIEEGWDDSPVYQYIENATGVKMHIDCPPGSEDELASVMIAAGTFPEAVVFGNYASVYLKQMIEAGQVLAFGDLIDQYAPKMWDLVPEAVTKYHTGEDGKLWAFTGMTYDSSWGEMAKSLGASYVELPFGANVMYIRQDLLNEYNQGQDITDLEEYTKFLYWVKDNHPDVDPVLCPSGSPRGGFFNHFKSTFGCHLSDTYPQEDGTLKYYMYDPHYVDYLKWLNTLYKDGIITQNMLTADGSTVDTKKYSASYGSMIEAIWNIDGSLGQSIKDAYGEDTDMMYVDCGPIQKAGIPWQTTMLVDKGGQTTAITTNADKPDRIIKFFEFLFTEECQISLMSGIKGDTWDYDENGKITYSQEIIDVRNTGFEELTNTYKVMGIWSPWITLGGYWEGATGGMAGPSAETDALAAKTDKRLNDWAVDIWQDGFADISQSVENGSDLDILRTRIDEVCNQAGMEMVIANDDAAFDKLYQDCLAEIEEMGVAQIEEVYTAEHQKQCKDLGIS